jgi:predicted NAD/FAD-binding protein
VETGRAELTLGEFLDRHRFAGELVDRFLLPLAAAIWSAAPLTLRAFPALTLVRFFHQHGMITVLDHPTWRVVKNGSESYIPKLLASPRVTTWTEAAPSLVRRDGEGVELTFRDRPAVTVDEVVFACHGDEVLPMLADPTAEEREVFGAFRTTENVAVLHTDSSWLPLRAAARASWNYLLGHGPGAATVTYHLNRLQRLSAERNYCVTLNPPVPIEPYHLLRRMTYRHPLHTLEAVGAQNRWSHVSGHRRTHYCGAYWYYGFHEDGVRSAVRVAEALGVTW